jgi:hypothetical protein
MSKPRGPWHYEFIAARPVGHQWRVGDQDDDMVADFATEDEAKQWVRLHNLALDPPPSAWEY